MLLEKKALSAELIDAQAAFELPERELLAPALVDVHLVVQDVTIQVPIAVAANLCDIDINVLAADLADDGHAECTATPGSIATPPDHSNAGGNR